MKENDDDEKEEDTSKSTNLLKDRAQKITSTGKQAMRAGLNKGKIIKKKIGNTTSEVISGIDTKVKKAKEDVQHEITKAALGGMKLSKSGVTSMGGMGSNVEDQLFSWYGYIWSIIVFGILILVSFTVSATDNRFSTLPFILLIAFPIYVFWVIYNAIPEIKIGNSIILSRKDVSIRKQMTFGKAIAKTFSREMIKNSPEGAVIIGLFLLLLSYLIIAPFL